jgi:hypothetical protein
MLEFALVGERVKRLFGLSKRDFEVDVVKDPLLRVKFLPVTKDDLLQLVILVRVELIRLADAVTPN